MGLSTPPVAFQNYNSEQSKKLAVVVDIPGLPYLVSSQIGRVIRYGDPIHYGDPGLIYGDLVPVGFTSSERGQKTLLNLDAGSLQIQQTLEPEQGRASISTLQLSFVDVNSYMTQVCSPGVIIPEILGQEVKIWIGYLQTSFPEDYFVCWRGRVAQTIPNAGQVVMQFVDPNVVKRQSIFYSAETTLSLAAMSGDTTINVTGNTNFFEKILGPDGATYDQNIKCYIKVDDEFIEYQQTGSEATGFGTNQFVGVSRGARGTVAAAHDLGATVDAYIELSGHVVDLALKIQLSGWGGPYLTGQSVALAQTGDGVTPIVSNAIVLPAGVDAVRDLGIAVGDYVTISGATNVGNDLTTTVIGFSDDLGYPNKWVLTATTFTPESGTAAVMAVRSQYDTLPNQCGCRLQGQEVDVSGHVFYKNTYLSNSAYSYRFLINGDISGKTFIENQLMLPFGAYCLTRQGKLSMGLTKPSLPDERTITLDNTNVIEPQNVRVTRAINNRKYWNEIDWSFDLADDLQTYQTLRRTLDTDSLDQIGISQVLPFEAQGARTDLGFLTIVADRERFLFDRYAMGAILIDLKVNFGTGNQIEVGDVVLVRDNGGLQIPNLSTGVRDLGNQLFEVINRTLDIKTGQTTLQLQGGIGALVTDRYATISPSSLLLTGSTSSRLLITDSFGAIFPGQEWKKWTDYVGLKVRVRSIDMVRDGTTVFTGLDPSNSYAMLLSPALGFTPQPGDIVDVAEYPNDSDPTDQALYKLMHAFFDPSVAVVSGSDHTHFTVGAGDIGKFAIGQSILVHNADYSVLSSETTVKGIVSNTIQTNDDLGFTPDNTMTVELIGFPDGGGPYRFI